MAGEGRPKGFEVPVDRSAATRSREPVDISRTTTGNVTAELTPSDGLPHPPRVFILVPGDRIADRYAVVEQLGRGGMSVVYLARDERIGRLVAVKVLYAAGTSKASRRILREASASNALDPARIARVFDVGETATGELFLVMEHVKGQTVRSLVREGRVELTETLRIVREVATALGEAHRAGLVHRDVKPDNVIVGQDGRVVLLDFGIVKYLAPTANEVPFATQLTRTGEVIGTPAYLAPEQALGRKVGPEADQFALAVTAFELLSGSLPWGATELVAMLAELLEGKPKALISMGGELSTQVDDVFARALAKEPGERFETVEQFAAALQAATEGKYVAAGCGGAPARPRAHMAKRISALIVVLAVLVGIWSLIVARSKAQSRAGAPSRDSVAEAIAALAGPEGKLACPIFEVNGVSDVAVRVGAAAASVTCMRAAWFLGGSDDRVLPPAILLDAPRMPVADLPDPYSSPEQRTRTVDAARARGAAYVDGTISKDAGGWLVSMVLLSADARQIAHGDARDATFFEAIRLALRKLWGLPLVTRTIDPEVSLWTGFPDSASGGIYAEQLYLDSSAGCDEVHRRGSELGTAYVPMESLCSQMGKPGTLVTGPHQLDESSPWAFVTSAIAYGAPEVVISPAEGERLALEFEQLYRRETSRSGRRRLAERACRFWLYSTKADRAHSACLTAVDEDPLSLDAWWLLEMAAGMNDPVASTLSVAAFWFPACTEFNPTRRSFRGDQLVARLRDARSAYLIDPGLQDAMSLGRALAEAGREDEARALAAVALPGNAEPDAQLRSYILGLVDLHGVKLLGGIQHLEESGNIGMADLVLAARVAGQTSDVSTKWAGRFLSLADEQVRTAVGYIAPMAICMEARRDLATRCLDRIAKLGDAQFNWWGESGNAFLAGALRYARGDVRGAVAYWRPLVLTNDMEIPRLLPSGVFAKAGQPELAARLDAEKMTYTLIGGVSEAAPREAVRTLAAGDRAHAKELAEKVVHAWEVADVDVPAVGEMRALLKAIGE